MTVDAIAKRVADEKVVEIVKEMARDFDQDSDWMRSWGPRFRGALIGKGAAPNFTAEQIQRAYDDLMQGWKWNKPPKPAHLTELARELCPPRPMQKRHSDPTPKRQWTDEERAANLKFLDEISAYINRQNEDPEYVEALRVHGRGSKELAAVVTRQRGEMQAWIDQNAP